MEMDEILNALRAHYQDKEPDSVPYVFPPPASAEQIAAVEAALGMAFPEELRKLYLHHAQMINAWGSITIAPVQSLPETHKDMLALAEQMMEEHQDLLAGNPGTAPLLRALGPVAPVVHTPTRIPFAADNARDILIDMQPPAGGKPGQIVRLDIERGEIEVIAQSVGELFEKGLQQLGREQPRDIGLSGHVASRLRLVPDAVLYPVLAAGALVFAFGVIFISAAEMAIGGLAELFRRGRE